MARCSHSATAMAVRRAILLVAALLTLFACPVWGSEQDADARLQALLAGAKQAQAAGDYAAAAANYRQAVMLEPGIAELWANLGLMNHLCGQYQQAITSFERALALKNSLFVPNLFLGIDLVQLKHDERALTYLRKAAALHPNDAQAPLALGRAYTALKQPRDASDAFATAVAIDASNSDAWFGLGLTLLEQVEADARMLTTQYPDSPYSKLLAGRGASAIKESQSKRRLLMSRLSLRRMSHPAVWLISGSLSCTREKWPLRLRPSTRAVPQAAP